MLMVIKETKRDVPKNESTPSAQQVTNPEGHVSHLSQVVQRVKSTLHRITKVQASNHQTAKNTRNQPQ
jgi:hypothetical protein